MGYFPYTISQPPAHLNFRNPVDEVDTAGTDHRDNEVRMLNIDHLEEKAFWEAEHT